MKERTAFDRTALIRQLSQDREWDILIIGGGATGLGIAVDAAERGYTTLLLEQHDFAKGTSSRSTKLIHGGVRYLAQGNIKLVYGALRERGLALRNAAHVVRPQSFIIPCYSLWQKIKYGAGLKIYDLLAGMFKLGKSSLLSRKAMIEAFPNIQQSRLKGGIEYFDGQFDDARLAINLAQTAVEGSAITLNYFKVTSLLKNNGRISGVTATDLENKMGYAIRAKTVINATGVFVDDILQMDNSERKPMVRPSQGIHLVVHSSFLQGNSALMIPKTSDGRVLFAVPWHDHVLIGTTDTPLNEHSLEPRALNEEIEFILNTLRLYISPFPERKDILSVFAGLRPLAAPAKNKNTTKEISRDHKLLVHASGLITITGGKWTTYRKMAEETVDKAVSVGKLNPAASTTKTVRIHGGSEAVSRTYLSVYGSDEKEIRQLMVDNPSLEKVLINGHPYTEAQVIWAVRQEMARTVEDVLARRLRLLFVDARAAINAAPRVAALIAEERGLSEESEKSQLDGFIQLANQYIY